jgi:hypothetical protein
MLGRLPAVGQWQRALIRASQLTIVAGIPVALTALFAPHKFDSGIGLAVQQQPQLWIGGLTLWLVTLLYAWTRQAMMVSRVVNSVYSHVKQYANDYDVLMRSTLRRNEFTPPDQINTLEELTRFINAMMQQALRDQQQLTECTVALGEERLQRSINERQTQYIRGGVSRVLHDGKDIHNDIMYLLDDLAKATGGDQREMLRRHIAKLQARLLRIIHLQLNFFPGEVVRKTLDGNAQFDLRQTVFDAYIERLWRFYDAPGYEALPRELHIPAKVTAAAKNWQWQVQELCARIEDVGALKGNPHDVWLCIDNMVFNAIDALSRADQQQLQPLLTRGQRLPALLLQVYRDINAQRVTITLRNRGPLIAQDLLNGNRIWQLRAAHGEEGGSHRGRGVGLYCIKQIIDAGYGGEVIIENIGNAVDRCSLVFEFADGGTLARELYIHASGEGGPPLIALGGPQTAPAALLPVCEFSLRDAGKVAVRRLQAIKAGAHSVAIDTVSISNDSINNDTTETILVDTRDAMAPRWYAVVDNSVVKFFPIDQRGVQVSLHIPASKFSTALT